MKTCNLLLLIFLLQASCVVYGRRLSRTERNSLCSNQPSGTILADTESCSSFIVCINGKAILRNCPSGFYYDKETFMCNLASLVECNLNDNSRDVTTCAPPPPCTTTPCNHTPTPPCGCDVTTPKDCDCNTAKPTTPCPPPPSTTTPVQCQTHPPSPAPCTTTPAPCTNPPPPCPTTPAPCNPTPAPCDVTTISPGLKHLAGYKRNRSRDCKGLINTIYLDRDHCGRFYECINDRAVRINCARGEWFDYERQKCRNQADVTNCVARKY